MRQRLERAVETAAKALLPLPLLRLGAKMLGRPFEVPVGRVRFGTLRDTEPVNRSFGYGRGQPVDRVYIEAFLARHAGDIQGRVLEVKDAAYTTQFGGARVERCDVLDVDPANPSATLVADLAGGDAIPSDAFDCIVLTQTLHLIYDVRLAAATLYRALKPGGVLLLTVPGITQVYRPNRDAWYWSFTEASARRLFEEAFAGGAVAVEQWGNVFAAVAFLEGVAAEEVPRGRLDVADPDYPVIVAVRAVKPLPA